MIQDWQKADTHSLHNDLDWAAAEGDDPEEWECVACRKTFRSEAAWDSHERSKKHMKEVELLKREMVEEDHELALDKEDEQEGTEELFDTPDEGLETPDGSRPPSTPPTEFEVLGEEGLLISRPPSAEPSDNEEEQPVRHLKKKKKKSNVAAPLAPPTRTEKRAMKTVQTINPSARREADVPDELPEGLTASNPTGITPDLKPTVDDVQGRGAEQTVPELSKREKRRAREAKKAEAGETQEGTDQVRSFAHPSAKQQPLTICLSGSSAMSVVRRSRARQNCSRISKTVGMLLLSLTRIIVRRAGTRKVGRLNDKDVFTCGMSWACS